MTTPEEASEPQVDGTTEAAEATPESPVAGSGPHVRLVPLEEGRESPSSFETSVDTPNLVIVRSVERE